MRNSPHVIVVALFFTLAVSFDSPINVCRAEEDPYESRADAGRALLRIEGRFIHSLTLEDAQG